MLVCGAQIIAITEVHEAEGELVEFGSRKSGARKATPDDKEEFYRELKWIQRQKGHKSAGAGTNSRNASRANGRRSGSRR